MPLLIPALFTDLCRLIYYSFERHTETFRIARTHPESCTIDFDSYKMITYVQKHLKSWDTDSETRHLTIVDMTRMSISPDMSKAEHKIYFVNFHIAIPSNTNELKRLFDTLQNRDVLKYATGHLYIDRIEFTDKPATYFLELKVRYLEEDPKIHKFIDSLAEYYNTLSI